MTEAPGYVLGQSARAGLGPARFEPVLADIASLGPWPANPQLQEKP